MPSSLVSLPMYPARPEALRAFWLGLRSHMLRAGLRDVPAHLSEPADLGSHWLDPALLLSQTCGYPLVHALSGKVQVVGIPLYAVPGFEGTTYSSWIVVRSDDEAASIADLRGRRAAFNSTDSQSGYNAFRALIAPHAIAGRFFGEVIETGGHLASLRLLQTGRADVAAIDCVSFSHAADTGLTLGLRTLCSTEPAPGLPLITSALTPPDDLGRLRTAFAAASTDPDLAECRAILHLEGFAFDQANTYQVCLDMEARAIAGGYPVLA